ncbi:hypothetical protein BH11PSE13_BH11PSE13_21590 [soil metagenome]
MLKRLANQIGRIGLALALTVPVFAMAQADTTTASRTREPSIDDIYKAAESGKLSEADGMIAKVLTAHPGSAKAHFVHAELLAKEGKLGAAKTAYAKAEELAPGLPFAKPEAVAGLLQRMDGSASRTATTRSLDSSTRNAVTQTSQPQTTESSSIGTPAKVGIVALLLAAGFFMFKRISGARPGAGSAAGAPVNSQAGYPNPSYGGPSSYAPGSMAPSNYPYAPPAPAAPSVTSGLGGALMTGAAVGLGAVAVEQAVRHLSQRDRPDDIVERRRDQPAFDNNLGPDTNADMGGSDFGISDAGSWDNGGGGGGDSGSDW